MNLGPSEIILILVVVLLFFGPSKLPNLGKSLGEAIRGFKKGINEDPQAEAKNVSPQEHLSEPSSNQKTTKTTKAKDTTKS